MGAERGIDPEELAVCTDCGKAYAIARTDDGDLHPAGTDGTCECGNDGFLIVD